MMKGGEQGGQISERTLHLSLVIISSSRPPLPRQVLGWFLSSLSLIYIFCLYYLVGTAAPTSRTHTHIISNRYGSKKKDSLSFPGLVCVQCRRSRPKHKATLLRRVV
ncbi:hypothetical protein BOTBODRAFT_616447 [Botryobasidium botryosum FD-172 SS1]|uniref:Uncharacterized protein n=1 Tax=Botryobasidium botryosum (strain FD-172 SS1) TaxID=930990 RepID=A0A067LVD8_BOTB1|nr:hypothetical protein BOTBODRAFT_616447 [Botryobasidium botryosum FD-172 SS1]